LSGLCAAQNLAPDADDLRLPGFPVVGEVAVVLAVVGFRHQHLDVAPDHLRARIAEQLFRRRVEGFDDAVLSIVMMPSIT